MFQQHFNLFSYVRFSNILISFSYIRFSSRQESWLQLVSLALFGGNAFPAILANSEEMAFIYRLDLSAVSSEMVSGGNNEELHY
jgi:hypothetical protein